MAAGEYISMQSQRELFERQIALERAELEAMPEEEEAELAAVYRAKGFTEAEADAIAARMFANPSARSTRSFARSSVSIRTSSGRRWGGRFGSFVAFAIGAAVPVLPYLVGERDTARSSRRSSSASLRCSPSAPASASSPAAGCCSPASRQVADRRRGRRRDVRRRLDHRRGCLMGDLEERLRAAGWDAGSWSNGPHDTYTVHDHGYDKVIVVAAGSIRFGLPDRGESVELAVGDRLDLPAGTRHDAAVGPAGVRCLEAHATAGKLAAVERWIAGSW